MPENDPQKKRPDRAEVENDKTSKRSYYYDDAHGYEEYDPDKEPDDDELEDEE